MAQQLKVKQTLSLHTSAPLQTQIFRIHLENLIDMLQFWIILDSVDKNKTLARCVVTNVSSDFDV